MIFVMCGPGVETHKAGENHKKKSASVQVFQCKLCWVVVTCQDTLDNHMRSKDHIKREKQLYEQREERIMVEEDTRQDPGRWLS